MQRQRPVPWSRTNILLFITSMLVAAGCGTEATAPGISVRRGLLDVEVATDPDPLAVSVLLDSFSIGGVYTVLPRGGYSSSGSYSTELNYAGSVNRHPTGIELPPGLPVRVLAEGSYQATSTPAFLAFWCGREDSPAQCAIQSYAYSVHGLVPGPGVFNPFGEGTGLRIQWNRTVPFEEVYFPVHPSPQVVRGLVPAAVAEVPPELHFRRLGCCYLAPPAGEDAFETYEGSWRFGVVPDDGGRPELGVPATLIMQGPRTDAAMSSPATFRVHHTSGEPLAGMRWWFIRPATNTFDGVRPAGSPPSGLASYPAELRTVVSELTACAGSLECSYRAEAAGAIVVQVTLPDGTGLSARNTGLTESAPELSVACEDRSLAAPRPAPSHDLSLVRGSVAECSVTTLPASAISGFTANSWSFVAAESEYQNTRQVFPDSDDPLTWRGTMAISGVVKVTGRFAGTEVDVSAEASLIVTARNWSGLLPSDYPPVIDVGQGTADRQLPVRPVADSLLGDVTHPYTVIGGTPQPTIGPIARSGALTYIVEGPNDGLTIFGRVPTLITGIQVRVNVEALQENSDFWAAQVAQATGVLCPRSVVSSPVTRDRIRVHEGTSFQPGSHTFRYRAAYQQLVGPAFEAFVTPTNLEQPVFGPLALSLHSALAAAAKVADEQNRVVWGPNGPCNFNFDY